MNPEKALETELHLKKQNELLQDAHKKMSLELHRLQVEEEMLMRKFFELSSTLGLNKKNVMSRMESNEEPTDVNISSKEGQ